MHRLFFALVGALVLAACGPAAPGSVTDDLGRTVALGGTPESVMSLAPNITELVATAAGVDRLAGVGMSDDLAPVESPCIEGDLFAAGSDE